MPSGKCCRCVHPGGRGALSQCWEALECRTHATRVQAAAAVVQCVLCRGPGAAVALHGGMGFGLMHAGGADLRLTCSCTAGLHGGQALFASSRLGCFLPTRNWKLCIG
jgi:hypothetical protein